MFAMGSAAIVAAAVLYGLHSVLDAKASAERAKAETFLAEQNLRQEQSNFHAYKRFADKAHVAERRAAESRAAMQRKLKPLRELTHASPSDDGPLPLIVVRFIIGLRQLQAGIIAPAANPDPFGPGQPTHLRPYPPSTGTP